MASGGTKRDDPIEPRPTTEVVGRTERIILSTRDSKRVLELLENPPKPGSALRAAARRRRARTG